MKVEEVGAVKELGAVLAEKVGVLVTTACKRRMVRHQRGDGLVLLAGVHGCWLTLWLPCLDGQV